MRGGKGADRPESGCWAAGTTKEGQRGSGRHLAEAERAQAVVHGLRDVERALQEGQEMGVSTSTLSKGRGRRSGRTAMVGRVREGGAREGGDGGSRSTSCESSEAHVDLDDLAPPEQPLGSTERPYAGPLAGCRGARAQGGGAVAGAQVRPLPRRRSCCGRAASPKTRPPLPFLPPSLPRPQPVRVSPFRQPVRDADERCRLRQRQSSKV